MSFKRACQTEHHIVFRVRSQQCYVLSKPSCPTWTDVVREMTLGLYDTVYVEAAWGGDEF